MPSARVRIAQRHAVEGRPYVDDPIEDYKTPIERPDPKLTVAQREAVRREKIEVC